jgi:hypothetical protein
VFVRSRGWLARRGRVARCGSQVGSPFRGFPLSIDPSRILVHSGDAMTETRVVLRLNQQQIELIDKTIARGEATDRAQLARRALKEFVARLGTSSKEKK